MNFISLISWFIFLYHQTNGTENISETNGRKIPEKCTIICQNVNLREHDRMWTMVPKENLHIMSRIFRQMIPSSILRDTFGSVSQEGVPLEYKCRCAEQTLTS